MHLTLALPADIAARAGVDRAAIDLAAVETHELVATAPVPAGGDAEADGDEQETSLLGSIAGLAPLILIGVLGYMMLIRPARRRQREQAELARSIEVGDEVVLTSGVVGFISAKEPDVYWVEIDDDVQIRVLPGAVSRKFTQSAGAGTPDADRAADSGDDAVVPEPAAAPPAKPSVKGRDKQREAPSPTTEVPAASPSHDDA